MLPLLNSCWGMGCLGGCGMAADHALTLQQAAAHDVVQVAWPAGSLWVNADCAPSQQGRLELPPCMPLMLCIAVQPACCVWLQHLQKHCCNVLQLLVFRRAAAKCAMPLLPQPRGIGGQGYGVC